MKLWLVGNSYLIDQRDVFLWENITGASKKPWEMPFIGESES